ncbi:hypothetical protein CGJ70_15235, partial [Vibrio parahaemolyticus]
MNCNKVIPAIAMSVAVSIPSTFAASTTETITDTAISVSKDGIETAGKLFALSVGSTPSTLNVGSQYLSVLKAVGGIAQQITDIAVANANRNRCRSTEYSYDNSQNVCESAPDFKKNQFCIVNMDNINSLPVRFELVNWNHQTAVLEDVISRTEVEDQTQICISRPLAATFLEVYNSSNNKILSRPLPVDLFNGEYGGLVKNGKFHLKKKNNEFHSIMGYHLCKNIMVNSPGFNSEETLARRCLDRLKENNPHINPKELDRLFTKTMKSTSFNALSRSLPGIFNQEYLLQNSGVDLETYEYSTRNG